MFPPGEQEDDIHDAHASKAYNRTKNDGASAYTSPVRKAPAPTATPYASPRVPQYPPMSAHNPTPPPPPLFYQPYSSMGSSAILVYPSARCSADAARLLFSQHSDSPRGVPDAKRFTVSTVMRRGVAGLQPTPSLAGEA